MIRTILFFLSCFWLIGLSFTFHATMDPEKKDLTRIINSLNVMVIFYMIMERYVW